MKLDIDKDKAMALANVPVNHYNVHAVVNAVFEWWLVERGDKHDPRVDCSCRRCARLLDIAHTVITMDMRDAPIVLVPFIKEARKQRWVHRPTEIGVSGKLTGLDGNPWDDIATRQFEDCRSGEA